MTLVSGNLISGNGARGILINQGSSDNIIHSNMIGTNAAGTAVIPNAAGITIVWDSNNRIGGLPSGNLISENAQVGVRIGAGDNPSSNNMVLANLIATDLTGTTAIGNGAHGVMLAANGSAALSSTTVGGVGEANVICGNSVGVLITGVNTAGNDNTVIGNIIGADWAGTGAIANGTGIRFESDGGVAVASNRILHNTTAGVTLTGTTSSFEATSEANCVVLNAAGVDNQTGAGTTFTLNGWGSPDGPSGAGPGAGDSVGADVVFSPFLAAAPTGCPTSVGMVTLVQDTLPDGPQDFDFSGDLGSFSLDDDADPALSNTISFPAAPGAHVVTASAVPGFDLVTIDCVDPSGDSLVDLVGGTAFIELGNLESVTCTFVAQAPFLSIPTLGGAGMLGLALRLMAIG